MTRPNRELSILKQRARRLAAPVFFDSRERDQLEVLVVNVGPARLAVELSAVDAVHRIPALTRLLGAPPQIAGLANLDGQVVNVLDLGQLIDGQASKPRVALCLVAATGRLALGVDGYHGVQRFAPADIKKVCDSDPHDDARLLAGVCPGGVGLLDMTELRARLGRHAGVDPQGIRRTPHD